MSAGAAATPSDPAPAEAVAPEPGEPPDLASGGRSAGGMAARLAGGDGAVPPEYEAYVRDFRRRVGERIVYPRQALRRGLHGTVELLVSLDASGRLTEVAVLSGEEPKVLREAAVRAVQEATPFPLPPKVKKRALQIRLPFVFELK